MNSMQPIAPNKWTAFPPTYRAEAVTEILHWVTLGESGVVIGASGTGKSNIAGYLANRPDVTTQSLPEPIDNYCFLFVDLNGLPVITTAYFYRTLLDAMQEAVAGDAELAPAMHAIMTRLTNLEDILGLYLAVQRAHQLLIQRAGKQVIWLFDRFDEGCVRLDAATLNSLRHLRDQFKDRLTYLAFARSPLARLRNPADYDEFHEIMVMHTCWVGAMNERDGRWVAHQVESRYRKSLPPAALQLVWDLVGGWPALLKVADSALASGELSEQDHELVLLEKLLALPAFQRNCQELWDGCSDQEKATLRLLALQGEKAKIRTTELADLCNFGLVIPAESGSGWVIFARIFAEFVRRQRTQTTLGFTLSHGQVYLDGVPWPVELTALEFRLLDYFCRHAGEEVCAKEELEDYLYPGETGGGIERLTQLVKRLRKKIGDDQKERQWTYIHAVHGRGYKFLQPSQGIKNDR